MSCWCLQTSAFSKSLPCSSQVSTPAGQLVRPKLPASPPIAPFSTSIWPTCLPACPAQGISYGNNALVLCLPYIISRLCALQAMLSPITSAPSLPPARTAPPPCARSDAARSPPPLALVLLASPPLCAESTRHQSIMVQWECRRYVRGNSLLAFPRPPPGPLVR